jgi:apolipoprotein N-acyltransferase
MKRLAVGVSLRHGALAVGTGGLSALSFPPAGWWVLALPAVGLLLLVLRDRDPVSARNVGLLYGLAYGAGTMYWLVSIFSVVAIPLIAIFAAYFGLLATLISLTIGYPPLARAMLVGLFATGVEWLRGDAWYLRFPWYTVPHALAQEPAWIAPVRWLGTYGFSFFIWFVAAWGAFGRPWYWALAALIPFSSLLLPGLQPADEKVLLVQVEKTGDAEAVIRQIPSGGADLAVLPEYAFACSPRMALQTENGPATLARKCACPVVFGAVENLGGKFQFRNLAVVIDSRGKVLGTFTKQRPVPLFRDGIPGKRRPVFPLGEGKVLGVAICYDFDAPGVAASLVRRGATVLVDPTLDALSWGRVQHVHHELLVRLRAVENDRWVLRSASSGRSEAVNPHGEASAEGVGIGEKGFVTVAFAHSDSMPWGSQTDFLGPATAAGSALVLVVLGARRWRERRSENPGEPKP